MDEFKKTGLFDGAGSEWNESDHPRDENNQKFVAKESADASGADASKRTKGAPIKKMTPADKIAGVHIDWTKDNILPELNENDLAKVGASKNKPVLLKKEIIERNAIAHGDLTTEESKKIIAETLYSPAEVFKGNNNKPYYNFVKPLRMSSKDGKGVVNGVVLLEVSDNKDNFEIVHWLYVRSDKIKQLGNKDKKKDD